MLSQNEPRITISIDKGNSGNDSKSATDSPQFVQFHGLFASDSLSKELKTAFVTTVTENEYDILLPKLLEFLESKSIVDLLVGEIEFVDEAPIQQIRFPSKQKLEEIKKAHAVDNQKCFEALLKEAKFPLSTFLRTQAESSLESLFYLETRLLMDARLKSKLSTDAQKLIETVQARLPRQMSVDVSNGKIDPVMRVIKEGAPVAPSLLRDCLYGVAYKFIQAEPKLVQLLIEKKSAVNVAKGPSPLILLFSCEYYDKSHERIKKVAEILLANGADLDATHEEMNAYQWASKHNFPSDILKMVRPPSAKRCGWF
jgi:hypothetical protein